MDCGTTKCLIESVAQILGSIAILTGGWWFLYTTQFKPRVQFDLDCHLLPLGSGGRAYLAEVFFIFENKGFVEHRLYDLSLSIHGLSDATSTGQPPAESTRLFNRRLFPRQVIVPPNYKWYFVRPGVRQIITYQALLSEPGPFIQVMSGFTYRERSKWPHTARRVFSVSSKAASAIASGTSQEGVPKTLE